MEVERAENFRVIAEVDSPFALGGFLRTLTSQPGIYQMYGASDRLLYVGKARNLKRRVGSYFQKQRHSPKTLAILCALQYPLWFGSGSWWNVAALHHDLEAKQAMLQQLENRNALLAAQVASLQTGSRAVEELARRHLGMVSKGEVFVWVIPANATRKDNNVAQAS